MAHVRVVRGNDAGKQFTLPAYAWVIGRGSVSDLVIDDPRASRKHACIRLHRGDWMVRDLGSPNGTFVNQTATGDAWVDLQHGDRIRVGHTVFVFEDEPGTPTPPPPNPRSRVPTSAAREPPVAPTAAPVLRDEIVIPGHRVHEKIGDGATGTVYRARELDRERLVAIKILAPALAKKPDYVKRFDAEARAAARLSHPHVIPVYAVGRHRGLHYFTMELMERGTVEDRLLAAPDSRLPWPEAVALISDAAAGLAHVHQHGLVHRDIKPANLLLGADGRVKLGDLGTLVHEAEAQGVRIGTPHFMSPEQARRERVTRASDVYSLGASLYRMLTGETPHQGANIREIVRAVAHDVPHPIEALREGLPQVVADEINAMMARDPARRPVDAGDVGKRLAAALEGIHEDRQSRRRSRRRKATWQAIAIRVGALGLVGGALFLLRAPVGRMLVELTGGVGPKVAVPVAPPPRPDERATQEDEEPSVPLRSAESDAATARAILVAAEVSLPPLDLASVASWSALATRYETLVDTSSLDWTGLRAAEKRARRIRDEVAAIEPVTPALAAAVDRRLGAELESAGAGALTTGEPVVPSLRPIRGGRLDPLRDARTTTLRRAAALVNERRPAEALRSVITWVRDERALTETGPAGDEARATIVPAVDWLRHAGRIVAARLESRIARDETLLARRLRETAFFSGLDGVADPSLALTRLDAVEALMSTPLGVARCRERRARLVAERATWSAAVSSGASPESVADAIVEGAGTLPRESLDGAIWLLLESGRRYRAEALLSERRLIDPEAAVALRAQIDGLRELATLGKEPSADAIAAWSQRFPFVDAALVGDVADAPGYVLFSEANRRALLDAWGD